MLLLLLKICGLTPGPVAWAVLAAEDRVLVRTAEWPAVHHTSHGAARLGNEPKSGSLPCAADYLRVAAGVSAGLPFNGCCVDRSAWVPRHVPCLPNPNFDAANDYQGGRGTERFQR